MSSDWKDRRRDLEYELYEPDEAELDRRRPRVSPGKRTRTMALARKLGYR